ncbi:ERF family protein [Bradyrhizobium sp. OK095]|uniref:ERF family protein n=1 Tax=Bradyrhizobium sp. OK095 TaxID=1882760 RepID=UPI0008C4CE74|nr:ERF family protein [Bradyrhizobium sp. OK095]SEN67713.1 ERF superfamily protein [Bradyrhizobium sp. OK095]
MSVAALPQENVKPIVRVPAGRAPAVQPQQNDIVAAALATGNVDLFREAVAFVREMKISAAREAFNNALADTRAELPIIEKNRQVTGDKGYWHEDLAQVVDTVTPILSKFGLFHRWKLQGKPGEPITVICVLSHRDGHQEENEISFSAETADGRTPSQNAKAAITLFERVTLMASLGLASRKDDDDGRSVAPAAAQYVPPEGSINAEQAEFIRGELKAKNASEIAFLAAIKQKRIDDIPAAKYAAAALSLAQFKKA